MHDLVAEHHVALHRVDALPVIGHVDRVPERGDIVCQVSVLPAERHESERAVGEALVPERPFGHHANGSRPLRERVYIRLDERLVASAHRRAISTPDRREGCTRGTESRTRIRRRFH